MTDLIGDVGVLGVIVGAIWFAAYCITLGVIFWRTRGISKDVQASSGKIEGNAKAHFDSMEAKFDAKLVKFEERLDEIEEPDLEAFGNDMMGRIEMFWRNERAQETKRLQEQLAELNIPGVTEEAKQMMLQQLPAQALQAQKLLKMKVSKRYAEEHPLEAQAIEFGKLFLMNQLEGASPFGFAPTGGGESPGVSSGKFGVR